MLPELCRLLRAKVFRLPQWSDAEDDAEDSQISAPALEATAAPPIHPFFRRASRKSIGSLDSSSSRSRSRSLSVSLAQEAQEAEMRRANVHRSKRGLDREWSTSRSFKGSRSQSQTQVQQVETAQAVEAVATEDRRSDGPLVLVESTPRKPKKRARLDEGDDERDGAFARSTVLVNSTPVKARSHQATRATDGTGPYDKGASGHESS